MNELIKLNKNLEKDNEILLKEWNKLKGKLDEKKSKKKKRFFKFKNKK